MRTDRAIGLTRSLVVYHAIPWRQRRLRQLYSRFVGPGDLIFDVGAHVGNRARAFAALGTYRFNWSPGETYRLASNDWCDGHALVAALRLPAHQRQSGDVYARLAIPALHVRSPK